MKYFLKYDPTPRTAISHIHNKIIKKLQLNETLTNQYQKGIRNHITKQKGTGRTIVVILLLDIDKLIEMSR